MKENYYRRESILEKRKDIDKYRENVGMVFQHFIYFQT